MKQNKPYIVAVTGGIATGKSTALNYIKMRGYEVIEFDKIGHDLLTNETIIIQMVNTFGKGILDQRYRIDRKALSKIVFSDKDKLKILNNITHPEIYSIAMGKINSLADNDIIFLDIPLLFETKNEFVDFYKNVNEIWVISSKETIQTSRLMIRDKISIEDAQNKIKSQMSLKLKERLADEVIYNNSDIYALYDEIRIELNNLKNRVNYKNEI